MINRSLSLAGSPAVAFAGAPFFPDTTSAPTFDDPVLAHIAKEFTRINTAVTSASVRTDDVRAAAANFRLFAAHVRAHDLDRQLRDALRTEINRKGRRRSIEEALQKAAAEHHPGMDHPTYEKLDRALDRLLDQPRLSDQMDTVAGQLSVLHGVLLKRTVDGANGAVIVRTQTVEELEHAIRCARLGEQCEYWQDQVTFWCFASMLTTAMCVAMQMSAAMYCGFRAYYGC